jgi:hypothetical protein
MIDVGDNVCEGRSGEPGFYDRPETVEVLAELRVQLILLGLTISTRSLIQKVAGEINLDDSAFFS